MNGAPWIQAAESLFFLIDMLICVSAMTVTVGTPIMRRFACRVLKKQAKLVMLWGAVTSLLVLFTVQFLRTRQTWMNLFLFMNLVNYLSLPFLYIAGAAEAAKARWPTHPAGSISPDRTAREAAILVALFLVPIAVSILIVLTLKIGAGPSVRQLQKHASVTLALYMLLLGIAAPVVEEGLLRHYLLPRLRNRLTGNGRSASGSITIAVLVTSLFFVLGHAGNMTPFAPKAVQIFLLALCCAAARIRYGTIWSILIHLSLNVGMIIIAFLLFS